MGRSTLCCALLSCTLAKTPSVGKAHAEVAEDWSACMNHSALAWKWQQLKQQLGKNLTTKLGPKKSRAANLLLPIRLSPG